VALHAGRDGLCAAFWELSCAPTAMEVAVIAGS